MIDILELESYASDCTLCSLHKGRLHPVFAKGNINSNIFICGMVPAHEENKVGIPFVGRAGKLLDHILESCNLILNDVYSEISLFNLKKNVPLYPAPEESGFYGQLDKWRGNLWHSKMDCTT